MKNKENTRHIPTPPGGGSWAFDEDNWEWVSTDSSLAPVQVPPAELVATENKVEKE